MTDFERTAFSDGRMTRFLDGSQRVVVALGATWIGRGEYQPGWRWSSHAQPLANAPSQAHVGYVVSGAMVVRSSDGNEAVIGAGEAWYSGPGHDAWVDGDEVCIALDFPTGTP